MVNKTTQLLRQMKRQTPKRVAQPQSPIMPDMFLPNQSGDHSVGIANRTPGKDNDIANKKYVDDAIAAAPSLWEAATDTDYIQPASSKFIYMDASAATAKAPISLKVDSDNITGNVIEVKGGAAGDKNWFNIIKNTSDTEGCQVIIDGDNEVGVAAKPSIKIGTTAKGIYASNANRLAVVIAGNAQVEFVGGGMWSFNATGFAVLNESASSTNPTIVPDRTDVNTGIGQAAADQLSLIAGGIEGLRVIEGTVTSLVGTTVQIPDLTTAPGANASSGGYLYSEGGALKWRGSGGTITTIAGA